MEMSKIKEETISLRGKIVKTIKTEMIVDKFLISSLWSGYHWHRVSDGFFVKYQADGGLGAPDVFVENISGL